MYYHSQYYISSLKPHQDILLHFDSTLRVILWSLRQQILSYRNKSLEFNNTLKFSLALTFVTRMGITSSKLFFPFFAKKLKFFTFECRKSARNFLFHLFILIFVQAWIEWISLQRTAATDTSGNDEFTSRVKIAKCIHITPILWGMLVSLFESRMIIFNDWVEQGGEDGVSFSVRSINSDAGIMIFQT